MKRISILLTIMLSFIILSVGCANTSQDEEPKVDDMEESLEEVDQKDPIEEVTTEEQSVNLFDATRDLDAYYYEVNTDLADGTSFVTNVWSSGNKTKMESNYSETNEHIIMIMDGEENLIYLYMPAENTALKMQLGNLTALTEDNEQQSSQDYIEIMKEFADDEEVEIENGTFEGESVKIVTGQTEGNTNKIWISDKTGFPLKSEFYMNGELESVATFTNFEEKSIAPSTFILPDNVDIQDMTNFQ